MMKYPKPSGQTPDAKDVKCYCFEKIGDNARCPVHGKKSELTALDLINWSIGIIFSLIVIGWLAFLIAKGGF